MDRQTIIGFVLIALVFTGWMLYTSMQTPPPPQPAAETTAVISDSAVAGEKGLADADRPAPATDSAPVSSFPDSLAPNPAQYRYGTWFAHAASGTEQWLTIETDKYTAVFSTRGGSVKRWTLKNQRSWNQKPLQLIDWEIPSDLGLFFLTSDGKEIDTRGLFHRFDGVPASGKVLLKDSAAFTFRSILPVRGDSVAIIRTYTLRNGSYTFDVDVEMKNMANVIANYEYQATLHSLALTEENSVDEASFAKANALVGSEVISLDASSAGEKYEENIDGETFWATTHNKYFVNALIVRDSFRGSGIYMNGFHRGMPDEGVREIYEVGFKVRYGGQVTEKSTFTY
jgi:YidC/Oxa1 family membrane protein insertase